MNKQNNIFDLTDSDKFVGSFISRKDVQSIMDVSDEDLSALKFEKINGVEYIDECKLKTSWERCMIPHAPCPYVGNAKVSLDELVLVAIIKQTLPEAKISRQTKWGRKKIDIDVTLENRRFFIEFHGPGHFKQVYKKEVEDPFIRKEQIEKDFSCECFIWPYWIQRCSLNLKILLGIDKISNGCGALWSTKGLFGQFDLDDSASIIQKLTDPFRAASDGNYGYMYEESNSERLVRIEHPIIKKILDGKENYSILIPKGVNKNERAKWLPNKLLHLIND